MSQSKNGLAMPRFRAEKRPSSINGMSLAPVTYPYKRSNMANCISAREIEFGTVIPVFTELTNFRLSSTLDRARFAI
jgi:hypothetical protein